MGEQLTVGLAVLVVWHSQNSTGPQTRLLLPSQNSARRRLCCIARACAVGGIRVGQGPAWLAVRALAAPNLCSYVVVSVPVQDILDGALQVIPALCCPVKGHISCTTSSLPSHIHDEIVKSNKTRGHGMGLGVDFSDSTHLTCREKATV